MTSNKLKILFIGAVDFSYSCLETLIQNHYQICGVITKEKSKFNSDFKDLTPLCQDNEIPFLYDSQSHSNKKIEFIKTHNPDVIYCFGWSYLLPKSVISIPKYGVIGFHPALLPNNRGRHPIIWALFLGLKKTGSTFFIMDEGTDTGDIISQREIEIDSFDDAGTLYDKIRNTAITQMLDFTNQLQTKSEFKKIIKQDKVEGNSWRKRGRIDGKIDFRMNTEAILNLIRALTKPYIGAHIEFNDQDIKIWSGKAVKKVYSDNIEPGKILESKENKIIVKTYDSAIELSDHEFEVFPLKNQYL